MLGHAEEEVERQLACRRRGRRRCAPGRARRRGGRRSARCRARRTPLPAPPRSPARAAPACRAGSRRRSGRRRARPRAFSSSSSSRAHSLGAGGHLNGAPQTPITACPWEKVGRISASRSAPGDRVELVAGLGQAGRGVEVVVGAEGDDEEVGLVGAGVGGHAPGLGIDRGDRLPQHPHARLGDLARRAGAPPPAVAWPNITSSLEKPKTKASFLSISVTSTPSPSSSESTVASSSPPKPAPRMRTRSPSGEHRARRRPSCADRECRGSRRPGSRGRPARTSTRRSSRPRRARGRRRPRPARG